MAEYFLVGVDEVGLGALAGPLVVCAVRVPSTWKPPPGLTDSKKLSPGKRIALLPMLQSETNSIQEYDSTQIDNLGVALAWATLARKAIDLVSLKPGFVEVIVDGDRSPYEADNESMPPISCVGLVIKPKADLKYPVVSAASVIAKVHRDRIMEDFDKKYPGYGFAEHKGYPTKAHKEALARLGPCPIHRRSYKPVAEAAKAGPRPLMAPYLQRMR